MKTIGKFIMAVLALACVSALADEVKVTINDGRKVYFPVGGKIKLLDRQGKISFVHSHDGRTYTFRRNEIRSFDTDMPKDVLALENIFRSMDFQKVVDLSGKVNLTSMWTGWGSYVSFLKAMAEMNLEKYADAADTLRQASGLYADADGQANLIKIGQSAVAYAKGGGSIIEKPSSYAMLLNGLALEKKNNLREAALEYMKAMELYPAVDGKGIPNLDRVVAMSRLVNVLKASKDTGTANNIAAALASGQ